MRLATEEEINANESWTKLVAYVLHVCPYIVSIGRRGVGFESERVEAKQQICVVSCVFLL